MMHRQDLLRYKKQASICAAEYKKIDPKADYWMLFLDEIFELALEGLAHRQDDTKTKFDTGNVSPGGTGFEDFSLPPCEKGAPRVEGDKS